MKIAYIAHPIGGDVQKNIERVLDIVRNINLKEADVVPFAPYLPDCQALDDNVPDQRARGIKNGHAIISRGLVDELRLYGHTISKGMEAEIKLAWQYKILVIPCTDETGKIYCELLQKHLYGG